MRVCVRNVSTMMDMWRWENILEISFLLPSCMWVPGIKLVIRFGNECFYPPNQLFPFNLSRMFLLYLLAFWECSKLLLHPCVSHSVPNSTDLTAYLSHWSTVWKDSHISADDRQLDQVEFWHICHWGGSANFVSRIIWTWRNVKFIFFSYFSVFMAV